MEWSGKPYHSLDFELKKTFGRKVYKLALDGGMTCPNRDGTLGTGGCIFCSEGDPEISPPPGRDPRRSRSPPPGSGCGQN